MANQDWKERLGVVFSTNPEFTYENTKGETLPPQQQDLRVMIDKKRRGGKIVTLVTGFVGQDDDLSSLAKLLKTKCGVGGTAKDGEIMVQGDFCEKILDILKKEGYKAKRSGG